MIPDPSTGRLLRAIAIGLVALCAVVHVATSRPPERTIARQPVGYQTPLDDALDHVRSRRDW